jgi:hypothetical protein
VLDLVLTRGELAIDTSAQFHLELPTNPAFLHADLGRDRGDAPGRAERGKESRSTRSDSGRGRSLPTRGFRPPAHLSIRTYSLTPRASVGSTNVTSLGRNPLLRFELRLPVGGHLYQQVDM